MAKWLVQLLVPFAALFCFQPLGYTLSAASPPQEYLKSSLFDLTILGDPLATKEQCIHYLRSRGPLPLLTVSVEELVDYYYDEGMAEGIRPDIAFAQALHETGNFRFGGDVSPLQNNFSGLGTTGGGVKGAWFSNARLGVRAQMQHLLGYADTRAPRRPLADPRYQQLKATRSLGQARTWTDLNGRWAVPGRNYGQMVLELHRRLLTQR